MPMMGPVRVIRHFVGPTGQSYVYRDEFYDYLPAEKMRLRLVNSSRTFVVAFVEQLPSTSKPGFRHPTVIAHCTQEFDKEGLLHTAAIEDGWKPLEETDVTNS